MTKRQSNEMCGEHEAKLANIEKVLDKWDTRFWAIIAALAMLVLNAAWERVSSLPSPVRSAQAASPHRR